MSKLIAERNTLQMLQGVEGYNKWNYWVFEKPLTQLENECKDTWLERLLHTAMAIEEQIVYTQTQSYPDTQDKENKVERLTNRLRDFREIIGFIPTIDGIEDHDYLKVAETDSNNEASNKKTYPQIASIKQENKFRKYLRSRLTGPSKVTLPIVWNELRNSEGETIDELIEVISVTGNSQTSVVRWLDDDTGIEGESLTRESVGKAISNIRRDIKKGSI